MGPSNSERPTGRPRRPIDSGAIRAHIDQHGKQLIAKLKLWGSIIASVLTSVVSAYGFVQQELDQKIAAAVQAHDEDRANVAHSALRVRLDEAETDVEKQKALLEAAQGRIRLLQAAQYEMYWFRVGEKAAELERDSRKRAQTRGAAQQRFESLVHDGETLEDAYRRALSSAAGLP